MCVLTAKNQDQLPFTFIVGSRNNIRRLSTIEIPRIYLSSDTNQRLERRVKSAGFLKFTDFYNILRKLTWSRGGIIEKSLF